MAVAFPPACVPAKNPSSSVHHTFLPPPHRSSTVKPRVASLASLAIRAEFPPRSNSRLVVARLSWNSNRTLTLAFALDAAAHRTKHTRNTPRAYRGARFHLVSLSVVSRARRSASPLLGQPTNRPTVHWALTSTTSRRSHQPRRRRESSSRSSSIAMRPRYVPAVRLVALGAAAFRFVARTIGRFARFGATPTGGPRRLLASPPEWKRRERTDGRTGPGRCEKTAVFDQS